jgi:hypothetical protein
VLNWHSKLEQTPPRTLRDGPEKRSLALRVGFVLGSAHMLFILANVIDIIHRHEGQWNMFWIVCGYIDFPVSLLLSHVMPLIIGVNPRLYNPYMAASHGLMFIMFLLFHTIIGSAWYFVLPVLVKKAAEKITATATAAAAAVTMMLIPIPIHWLQLLRFFGRDTAPTAIGLNSVLPSLWMALFVWLLFTNARRRATLWLLCLSPPVFYYLLQDLYYYIMLARHTMKL